MISGVMKNFGIQTHFLGKKQEVGEASRVKKTPENSQTNGKKGVEGDTFTANPKVDNIKVDSGDKFEKTPQKK